MILGVYLRNIKIYKNINYIPVGFSKFTSYLGENGSGKSSILEGFDAFFNNKEYIINRIAKKEGKIDESFPYFLSNIFN